MKKLLFLFIALYLLSSESKAQIVISGYMANPSGTDSAYEYAQFVATQDIDFSQTPYSVVFLNNGNVGSKGWVQGSNITYSFYLNSGSVSKGEEFYVGGSEKRIAGTNSADISSAKWIRAIATYNTTGDGFGSSALSGVLGNGGSNADGIGVFKGEITQNDSFEYPIDCIFFGDAVGGASASGIGYLVNKNSDYYDPQYGYFGDVINTFLFPGATANLMVRLKGTFNASTNSWDTARVVDTATLSAGSSLSDIKSEIILKTLPPEFSVNLNGFSSNFGNGYLNEGLAKVFTLTAKYLSDSVSLKVNAPFELKVNSGSFSSDTLKVNGNIGNEDIFVRFNPSALGTFEDTVYINAPGQNMVKIYVKGNAILRPEIGFTGAKRNILESADTQTITIKISNPNTNATNAKLVVLDSIDANSAVRGYDYHFYVNNAVNDTLPSFNISFPANSSNDVHFKIKTVDNNIAQEKRSIKFAIINQTNGAVLGTDTMEFIIEDDDYRQVDICPLRNQNSFGVADSLGRLYEIKGIVYGKNTGGSGYQFTLINGNCGININSPSGIPSYTVRQGDSIMVRGRLAQVNGLTQLQEIDSLYVITVFTTLKKPAVYSKPGENNESNLVLINNVRLKDTATGKVWAVGDFKAYVPNTPDTFLIKINTFTHELLGKEQPLGKFDLIGIVGQDDSMASYLHNYYIVPRDSSDIVVIEDSLSAFDLISPADFFEDTLKGLLSETIEFIWQQSKPASNLAISSPSYQLLIDDVGADFSIPLFSMFSANSGYANSVVVPFNSIVNFLNGQGVVVGQTVSYDWNVVAQIGNYKRLATKARAITFFRGAMSGINNSLIAVDINAYPNPAGEYIYLNCTEKIKQLSVYDMQGKLVKALENVNDNHVQLLTDGFASGNYTVQITTSENNTGSVKFTKK